MTAKCLFCDADDATVFSKEDVVPKWLLHYLALPSHDKTYQAVVDSKSGQTLKESKISSFRFREPRVCKLKCNNGWMSRLEIAVKPILIPLMDNTRQLTDLSDAERTILARWTTKTVFMHSYASLLERPVQLAHLATLNGDDGLPPEGIVVVGYQGAYSRGSSHLLGGPWFHAVPPPAEPPPAGEVPRDAYKLGLQFKHLYLITAFWPKTNVQYSVAEHFHVPIWPIRKRPWGLWQSNLTLSNDSVAALAELMQSLVLLHLP